jgi:hypothetical protein
LLRFFCAGFSDLLAAEFSSVFTIAGVLPDRMGDRATHRVLSRALFASSANALLILHVCNPFPDPFGSRANVAHAMFRVWNLLSNAVSG